MDPYYLTHKAQEVGHHPEIILAGRRINDAMGSYVVAQVVKRMTQMGISVKGANVLIMGLTFKENTPDLRNSRVIDMINELAEYEIQVDVTDPWADSDQAVEEFGVKLTTAPPHDYYQAIILAVAHEQFASLSAEEVRAHGKQSGHVVCDLKGVLGRHESDVRL